MRYYEIIGEKAPSTWSTRTYLEANCLPMAMAIQRELGWSLALLSFGGHGIHALANNPHGGYADVRGPRLSEAQALEGFKPLIPSWKPTFEPATAEQIAEIFEKHPSQGLLDKAHADLFRFWGQDVVESLRGQ